LGSLGKQFGWQATRLTAAGLGVFCLGIFGSALIALITRAFFSLQDTKTPTLVTLIGVGLNVTLSFTLVWAFSFTNTFRSFFVDILKLKGVENVSVVGLPLAFSIAALIHFLVLLFAFIRKMKKLNLDGTLLPEIISSSKKIVLASAVMVPFVYLGLYTIDKVVSTNTVLGLSLQGVSAGLIGVVVFLGISLLVKTPELAIVQSTLKRALFKKGK